MNRGKKILTALLTGAFFMACNNPPTAPRSLPRKVTADHLGAGPSALWTFESLPKNHGAVTFDASASHGGIVEYVWAFGDGESAVATSPLISHTFAASGTYNVTLCVSQTVGTCFQFGAPADYRERSVVVKGAGRK